MNAENVLATVEAAKPAQRLAHEFFFNDEDMDLFFVAAAGWGSSGGLELGQAMHVASAIVDGDADSWVRSFGNYGDHLNTEADAWLKLGCTREAGVILDAASGADGHLQVNNRLRLGQECCAWFATIRG